MTTIVDGAAGLTALVGTDLGHSDWMEITQDRVNLFADATGDHQWIHVDPERAKDGPFGGTIAHGYLTLSLAPALVPAIVKVTGFAMAVNYGCGKVRFPSPVRVGSKMRAAAHLDSVDEVPGGVQVQMTLTFEVDGADKPACVAEVIYRYFD